MNRYDVVYVLKNDIKADELKYSLRSVEKNFPHRDLWFIGGCPEDIKPDHYIPYNQEGKNKWEKVNNSIRILTQTRELSEDFWLFNDDFFVMKEITETPPHMVAGTLAYRVQKIRQKHNSAYADNLARVDIALKQHGLDRLDYALHVPMLINKEKAAEVLDAFRGYPMFRSLYGNYWKVGGIITNDVKIQNLERQPMPDSTFLSTNDTTFRDGKVGEYIRGQFKDKCRWEK